MCVAKRTAHLRTKSTTGWERHGWSETQIEPRPEEAGYD